MLHHAFDKPEATDRRGTEAQQGLGREEKIQHRAVVWRHLVTVIDEPEANRSPMSPNLYCTNIKHKKHMSTE